MFEFKLRRFTFSLVQALILIPLSHSRSIFLPSNNLLSCCLILAINLISESHYFVRRLIFLTELLQGHLMELRTISDSHTYLSGLNERKLVSHFLLTCVILILFDDEHPYHVYVSFTASSRKANLSLSIHICCRHQSHLISSSVTCSSNIPSIRVYSSISLSHFVSSCTWIVHSSRPFHHIQRRFGVNHNFSRRTGLARRSSQGMYAFSLLLSYLLYYNRFFSRRSTAALQRRIRDIMFVSVSSDLSQTIILNHTVGRLSNPLRTAPNRLSSIPLSLQLQPVW